MSSRSAIALVEKACAGGCTDVVRSNVRVQLARPSDIRYCYPNRRGQLRLLY